MNFIKDFFESIDFSFGKNILPSEMIISENSDLTDKLKNNVFVYRSKNIEQTKSSFYIISSNNLSYKELFEVRRYIWNEDKYDLYFNIENSNIISLNYAKTDPQKPAANIDSFKRKKEDEEKLEKIKEWRFKTGAFWLSYSDFINKIKKSERIDEKLIRQLKELKKKLIIELGNDKTEIVQSLIDRTLFIKFLEDNHIINSYFYNHLFNNKDLSYKQLLNNNNAEYINLLFEKINEIFSNVLFEKPHIEEKYIIKASNLLYRTISQDDLNTGQLSLFDFRFDIIPIEFISHIYEVFLEDDQLDQGIYYTPPKLAQLIIDDTIAEEGKVLDPACGSGLFLILAFRVLIEKNPLKRNANISEKIKHKIELLQKFIFGIEKENTAWRLTIFSLYLEILKGLPNEEIKEYIKQKIDRENDIEIFPDFSENIINGNSLEIIKENLHFINQTFDYIVGNPPFLQISPNAEEISFINNYSTEINEKKITATDVVGYNQISQAFMLKIKDWANENTKFGFVLNSSNFYNEKSDKFQKFFFENYQIENFYELSRVKKILFKKAKESVVVAIFNNKKVENNIINYYPVDLELFSDTFKLLVIQEDKRIEIEQEDIPQKQVVLRDYLIGNEFDLRFINKLIKSNANLNYYIDNISVGIGIMSKEVAISTLDITEKYYISLTKREKRNILDKAKSCLVQSKHSKSFSIPYIEYSDIDFFKVSINNYLREIDIIQRKYRRNKDLVFFEGDKILIRRVALTKNNRYFFPAYIDNQTISFTDSVFSLRIIDKELYYLFVALLNSDIVNFLINIYFLSRVKGTYPKINKGKLLNIPIPKELDEDIVAEISEISQQLIKDKLKYEGETKEKLNKLIFDLYDLSYLERQRIKDFFSSKKTVTKKDFEQYKQTLENMFELYFVRKPLIVPYQDKTFGFDLAVVAIYFNKSEVKQPTAEKTLKYIICEEILKNSNENFLVMREKIIENDCVYIIKSNKYNNWTTTKAFEDGKNILKSLKK